MLERVLYRFEDIFETGGKYWRAKQLNEPRGHPYTAGRTAGQE